LKKAFLNIFETLPKPIFFYGALIANVCEFLSVQLGKLSKIFMQLKVKIYESGVHLCIYFWAKNLWALSAFLARVKLRNSCANWVKCAQSLDKSDLLHLLGTQLRGWVCEGLENAGKCKHNGDYFL